MGACLTVGTKGSTQPLPASQESILQHINSVGRGQSSKCIWVFTQCLLRPHCEEVKSNSHHLSSGDIPTILVLGPSGYSKHSQIPPCWVGFERHVSQAKGS